MVEFESVRAPWRLILPQGIYSNLHAHLFPGDNDEHGAIITAGIAVSGRGVRLLARELFVAVDGVDYVPGKRGYRMLKAILSPPRSINVREQRSRLSRDTQSRRPRPRGLFAGRFSVT